MKHPDPSNDPRPPEGFQFIEKLASGGMGVVFRAKDIKLDREVAIKFLKSKYSIIPDLVRRFERETRLTGKLQHPGVPPIHRDGCLDDGRPYLVMKLIKGSTLQQMLAKNEKLDTLAVFESIAQTVGYAHTEHVIHRDLKPLNVMVGTFSEVQVMDWGLAKMLQEPASGEALDPDPYADTLKQELSSADPSDLTKPGAMLGTVPYMSPEQANADLQKINQRSDLFGLGAILCAMLTGRPPYSEGDVLKNVRAGNTKEAFRRIDKSKVDRRVKALCKRCLALKPEDRYSDR